MKQLLFALAACRVLSAAPVGAAGVHRRRDLSAGRVRGAARQGDGEDRRRRRDPAGDDRAARRAGAAAEQPVLLPHRRRRTARDRHDRRADEEDDAVPAAEERAARAADARAGAVARRRRRPRQRGSIRCCRASEFARAVAELRARRARHLHAVPAGGAGRGVVVGSRGAVARDQSGSVGRPRLARRAVRPEAEGGRRRRRPMADLDPIVDALRTIKSAREIAIIREATRIDGTRDHGGDARRAARHDGVRAAGAGGVRVQEGGRLRAVVLRADRDRDATPTTRTTTRTRRR